MSSWTRGSSSNNEALFELMTSYGVAPNREFGYHDSDDDATGPPTPVRRTSHGVRAPAVYEPQDARRIDDDHRAAAGAQPTDGTDAAPPALTIFNDAPDDFTDEFIVSGEDVLGNGSFGYVFKCRARDARPRDARPAPKRAPRGAGADTDEKKEREEGIIHPFAVKVFRKVSAALPADDPEAHYLNVIKPFTEVRHSLESNIKNLKIEKAILEHMSQSRAVENLAVDGFRLFETRNAVYFLSRRAWGSLRLVRDNLLLDSVEDIRYVYRDCLKGVRAMNELGLLHLDLKSDNILVSHEKPRRMKLTDFDLSQAMDPALVERLGIVQAGGPWAGGTKGYQAPEVIKRKGKYPPHGAAPSTDVYSLFVVIWTLLFNGRKPFVSNDPMIQSQNDTFRYLFKMPGRFADKVEALDPRNRPLAGGSASPDTPNLVDVLGASAHLDVRERPTARDLLQMPFFKTRTNFDRLCYFLNPTDKGKGAFQFTNTGYDDSDKYGGMSGGYSEDDRSGARYGYRGGRKEWRKPRRTRGRRDRGHDEWRGGSGYTGAVPYDHPVVVENRRLLAEQRRLQAELQRIKSSALRIMSLT